MRPSDAVDLFHLIVFSPLLAAPTLAGCRPDTVDFFDFGNALHRIARAQGRITKVFDGLAVALDVGIFPEVVIPGKGLDENYWRQHLFLIEQKRVRLLIGLIRARLLIEFKQDEITVLGGVSSEIKGTIWNVTSSDARPPGLYPVDWP